MESIRLVGEPEFCRHRHGWVVHPGPILVWPHPHPGSSPSWIGVWDPEAMSLVSHHETESNCDILLLFTIVHFATGAA